uniref:Coiled-coil domain containing 60 n=1 Tax=Piliocolobus tephrosceles TaxID=591936 RepID=A0A8C9GFN2_9PRIM
MTKVPATKKLQSSPNAGAVRPFYASENLRQVPDKPMKSIKYMDKEIINLKKDLIRSRLSHCSTQRRMGKRPHRKATSKQERNDNETFHLATLLHPTNIKEGIRIPLQKETPCFQSEVTSPSGANSLTPYPSIK